MLPFFLFFILFFSDGVCEESDASCCNLEKPCDKGLVWYGRFEMGYAYSYTSYLFNPDPAVWDTALEGYASSLGGAPYVTVGFGGSFLGHLEIDGSYTHYQNFYYQKHQTGQSPTPYFSGAMRNRFFTLTHQNVMLNTTFSPKQDLYFSFWGLDTTLFAGLGVGCGFSRVFPFYTVGYIQDVGSVTSTGIKRESTSFAWQGSCGVRIHPNNSCCFLNIGYMFYDGGAFRISEELSVNDVVLEGDLDKVRPLRGHLKTNQVTISFECFF